MAFTWKDKNDIFKGEGIYHLTFSVVNRIPLLGALRSLPLRGTTGHTAWTEATELGRAVQARLNMLTRDCPYLKILAKQLMPDHLHVVIYMHEGWEGSIKMIARSYSQGCSKDARRIAAARRAALSGTAPAGGSGHVAAGGAGHVPSVSAQSDCAAYNDSPDSNSPGNGSTPTMPAPTTPPPTAPDAPCYDCGNGANTLFSPPFIRTLARKGQLNAMIKYVHANPDNAWLRRQHPDLYVIRRRQQYAGLTFDTMGKTRLLDYP